MRKTYFYKARLWITRWIRWIKDTTKVRLSRRLGRGFHAKHGTGVYSVKDIGARGESYAVEYLKKEGHRIRERNFSKKYGEIDIVSEKAGIIHFVEVKSAKRRIGEAFAPYVHIDRKKRRNLPRIIQAYLSYRNVPENVLYQVDVAVVYLDGGGGEPSIEILENVEL